MNQVNEATLVLILCIVTVLTHIGLMFVRGWLIEQVRKEQRKQRVEWERFQFDQDKWREKFESEHNSPWGAITKQRSA